MKLGRDEVIMDDGKFEMLLVRNPRTILELQGILTALLNQNYHHEDLIFRHISTLTAGARRGAPLVPGRGVRPQRGGCHHPQLPPGPDLPPMREIDAIAARCGGRDPEWMDEKRRCAVLVPFLERDGEMHVLFERRAGGIHPGRGDLLPRRRGGARRIRHRLRPSGDGGGAGHPTERNPGPGTGRISSSPPPASGCSRCWASSPPGPRTSSPPPLPRWRRSSPSRYASSRRRSRRSTPTPRSPWSSRIFPLTPWASPGLPLRPGPGRGPSLALWDPRHLGHHRPHLTQHPSPPVNRGLCAACPGKARVDHLILGKQL